MCLLQPLPRSRCLPCCTNRIYLLGFQSSQHMSLRALCHPLLLFCLSRQSSLYIHHKNKLCCFPQNTFPWKTGISANPAVHTDLCLDCLSCITRCYPRTWSLFLESCKCCQKNTAAAPQILFRCFY